MMAIFAVPRVDGSTVVAIDGNGGYTDLFLRGLPGGVQLATNSEFQARTTFDPLDWVNASNINDNLDTVSGATPLYITSATPNSLVFSNVEANGFTAGSTNTLTDFVLSNGNINTTTAGAVAGTVTLGGNVWSFTNDQFGRLSFTPVTVVPGGPAPVGGLSSVSPGTTQPDVRGAGVRGGVTIRWSSPVSTFVDDCPRIDVTYTYRNFVGLLPPAVSPPPDLTGFDAGVGVSVGIPAAFTIPGGLPKNGFGGVTVRLPGGGISEVPGTSVLSGTITVHDVVPTGSTGSSTVNLTFGFSDATGALVFTPTQSDWLEIVPGSTLQNLRFRNVYGVSNTELDAGESVVQPGRVTVAGGRRWLEYTIERQPSQVTVWPGLDVANAITLENTRSGGAFNVLSPIVSAPSLAVLGATSVSLEAPISVAQNISLSGGTVPGVIFQPQVVTAVFDAPSAADIYSFEIVGGSLRVSPSGSLAGALPDAQGELTTAARLVRANMDSADLLAYGTIFATTQFYDLTSPQYSRSTAFTTQPDLAGPDTGLIRGGTVVVNMAHPGPVGSLPDALSDDISFHTVSLRTQVDTFRTRAAGTGLVLPAENIYPYDLQVRELDAIAIDAVAGSSRPIALTAGGSIAMGAALSTASDVTIQALRGGDNPSRLSVTSPLATTRGKIQLVADGVTISNSVLVTAADKQEDRDDITITANAGDVSLYGLVSAVNRVNIQQSNPFGPTSSRYDNRNSLPIPDSATVTQTLQVNDDFVFDDVDVVVDITHPFVGDLSATLIAPDGRRVRLFNRIGNAGDNFTNTIFNSEATVPITSGVAPFTGSFQPVDSLQPLYGSSTLGTWQLEVVDSAVRDTGTLNVFSLVFRSRQQQQSKVFGAARVVADSFLLDVQGSVGNSKLLPVDTNFFLRTDVNSLTGTIGGSASFDELNDIDIPNLRAGGFVSLRANGVDPVAGPNVGNPALRANLIDITGLDVATPAGSVDVLFDTAKNIELGNAQGLRTGRSLNSLAAGNVSIRSTAGSIVVLDGPVAGGNARAVRVATADRLGSIQNGVTLSLVAYNAGNPGVTASTLRGRGNLNTWLGVQIQPLRVGDRVLVKDQANPAQNGVYTLTFMSTPAWTSTTTWTLTRAADSDTALEFAGNSFVSVRERQAAGVDQVGTWQITANYVPLNGATLSGASYSAGSTAVTVPSVAGLQPGMVVFGANIQPDTTIDVINGITLTLTLTKPTTAASLPSETLKFVGPAAAMQGSTGSGLDDVLITGLSATAGLEVGMLVVGAGIPDDTVITRVLNGTAVVLSNSATAAGTAVMKFIRPFTTRTGSTDGVTVSGLSTTRDLREGMVVVGPGIPADTTIASIVNASTLTLSRSVTSGQSGASLKFLAATTTNFGLAPIAAARRSVSTNIGSDDPNDKVTFVVSTNGGNNAAAGSLGKMITLRQENIARLAGDTTATALQPMDFRFSAAVATDRTPIRLTQELPAITTAFEIGGSPTYPASGVSGVARAPLIDGSRITRTRSGRNVVDGDTVSGFLVSGAAASGTVIRNVDVGGFARVVGGVQSAAIEVQDAAGVLVRDVTLGVSELGLRLGNGVGVRFTGAGATSGTVLNAKVFGSNDAGLVVENGATGVTVVGSTFGRTDIFNSLGARFASGVNQFGVDPVTPVQPIPQVQATRIAANRFTLPANWSAASRLVPGLQILAANVNPASAGTRATIGAISTNVATGVTTVTVVGGVVAGDGPVTFVANVPTSFAEVLATRVDATTLTLPAASKAIAALVYPGLRLMGPGIQPNVATVPASVAAVSLNPTTGVTTVTLTGGTITRNGSVKFGDIVFTELNGTTVSLPGTVNMDNLFLGQGVSGTGFAGGAVITAIDRSSRTVSFAEDKRITRSGFSSITFAGGGRNVVTLNRNGLALNGGATTVTNSTITANTFDGIVIRGSGVSVGGQEFHHRIGTNLAPSTRSNQIHANGGWGVFFTSAVSDGIKNVVRIQGNYLGTTTLAVVSAALSNRKGNIGHVPSAGVQSVFAGLGSRLVPRVIDGLDPSNNQHGRYQGTGGGAGGGSGGV
jgi:subtilisin-like proprotein convertase family protein